MGHSKATTASHESRTIHTDAAFLLPHIRPNHKILDVGCGPGTITLGFADLVPQGSVVGVDYSANILQRASALASSQESQDRVVFQQADILERTSLEDDSFDIIFASQLFPHLVAPEEPIAAMKEIRRILKPGGIFATRDASVMYFRPYTAELDRLWTRNLLRGTKTTEFPGPQVKGWLRAAGFDVDDTTKANFGGGATVYANRDACKWWCSSLAGRLAKGDKFRQSWIKVGIPEEECDECVSTLHKWADSEDAYYGLMQSEVLAWK